MTVTGALVRKELGELRPWAILSLFLGLSELATQLLEQVDMLRTEATIGMLSSASGRLYWLIALAIGTGLGVREAEDGTLAFLDGLPVGRTRVYLVKCAVTCVLLAVGPLVSLGSIALLHELSHGSLDADLRADIVLGRFGLQLLVIVSGVTLGTAFGWLRSLTWLVLGVLTTGLSILIDQVPRAAVVSPFSLLKAPITSAPFRVDPEGLIVQLALAVLCGSAGWIAFLRAGKPSSTLDLRSRPVVSALVTVLTVMVATAAISLNASDAEDEGDAEPSGEPGAYEEPRFEEGPPSQTATKHYRFSYPAQHARAALDLASRADAIYERVHGLLAMPPTGSIDVDGSGSLENTDGTAYFGRVRISLASEVPEVVLAHETAHVIARRLAGDERAWLWRKAYVLDEGLATWVERHFAGSEQGDRSGGRLVLAALHSRGELLFEELVDPTRLAEVRDDNLKYPAGEAVIAAIIRLHGPDALPRLIRAFATPSLPVSLEGMELWQATFQLAGIDLGKVIDELFREVASDADERRAEIAALPRVRIRIVTNEHGAFGIQPIVEPAGAEAPGLVVRFKPEPGSSFDDYETWPATQGQPLWRGSDEVMNAQLCAQAGLTIPPDQTLYEPWVCLPTTAAETFPE